MSMQRNTVENMRGIWIPLITPFNNGEIDERSVRKLVEHYSNAGVSGLIVAATTGESMSLSEEETRRLVDVVQDANAARLPVLLGRSGSNTRRLASGLSMTDEWPIDGYLVPAPYYVKPSQEGIYQHFMALVEATDLPIVIYNIPYRTGVNILNETMLRLAANPQIIGVKDCCAIMEQSVALINNRPSDFAVMVGDDANFFRNVFLGADGGILASAHIAPDFYVRLLDTLRQDRSEIVQKEWDAFAEAIAILFAEPNPSPLKFWLWHQGLIASPEVRLPMLPVSQNIKDRINSYASFHLKTAA